MKEQRNLLLINEFHQLSRIISFDVFYLSFLFILHFHYSSPTQPLLPRFRFLSHLLLPISFSSSMFWNEPFVFSFSLFSTFLFSSLSLLYAPTLHFSPLSPALQISFYFVFLLFLLLSFLLLYLPSLLFRRFIFFLLFLFNCTLFIYVDLVY